MSKLVYDIIKRQNGEAFAKAIRQFDSGIFDIENLPHIVRYAGRNALPLLGFLEVMKLNIHQTNQTNKTPFQLLEEAGYDAFYVDSLEKQNSIKPYFKEDEALCTFNDEERYQYYHIIHAVKKNVDSIKRENFNGIEEREDEYGTSVLSIQILKTGGFIKICNRYNHTVEAPDNTFDSNPDNIIKGLTCALQRYFNVDFIISENPLPYDYTYQNGRIFKFIDEMNNIYYGEEFYLKNGVVYPVNKDYQLMANGFLIDFKQKKVFNITNSEDNLFKVLKDELEGACLAVQKKEGKTLVFADGKEILSIQEGNITKLSLYNTKKLNHFLVRNFYLEEFYGYQVEEIRGKSFFNFCVLKKVVLPRCKKIDQSAFFNVKCKIQAPLMEKEGFYFFEKGIVFVPKLKLFYLRGNLNVKMFKFLNAQMANYDHFKVKKEEQGYIILADKKPFLRFKNNQLTGIYLHKGCPKIDEGIIADLDYLEEFSSEKTIQVEAYNFLDCQRLKKVSLPNVEQIYLDNTFRHLASLEEVDLSSYKKENHHSIFGVNCPNLKRLKIPLCEVNDSKEYCYLKGMDFGYFKHIEKIEVKNGVIVQNNGKTVGRRMIYDELLFVKKRRTRA